LQVATNVFCGNQVALEHCKRFKGRLADSDQCVRNMVTLKSELATLTAASAGQARLVPRAECFSGKPGSGNPRIPWEFLEGVAGGEFLNSI
jgi:hypothetical protein